MSIFIVGSTGKVGRAWLRMDRPSEDLQMTGLGGSADFDLATESGTDSIVSKIRQQHPQLLVLAAAMTNVDLCDQRQEQTNRVNVEAVGTIAAACAELNVGLIFYSSDHVFDGSGPKSEDEPPAPLNAYGRSKVAAELMIRDAGGEHLIVRINVPLAPPDDGESFYSFVARKLLADQPLKIVTDQWNNPLDTGRIAQWSYESWRQGVRGLLHLGGGSYLTRFDCARLIADHLHKGHSLIEPIHSEQLNQVALRPRRGGLLIARQSELFGTAPDLAAILKSLN